MPIPERMRVDGWPDPFTVPVLDEKGGLVLDENGLPKSVPNPLLFPEDKKK